MARVFVVREVALGRDVVVKVLPPELGAGLNIGRFRREIQLAARLQHPHIVPLLFAGSKDDLLYYAMPRVEGETLRARLQRSGELTVAETVRILHDVADAIDYAHRQGVVHRDIKPENILLSGNHAVVTDFGIAKAVSAAHDETGMTSAGIAIGTPTYMSPEQALGKDLDQRSDLFALGLIFYELLTGKMPYKADSVVASLLKRTQERAAPVSSHEASIPSALSSIVSKCLETEVKLRYQSSAEILADLNAW
ncbi:MAG TPA: serine/threonine-protein kinase, partial [Gemmatimonadaceae bacterium]|nr:serine/threonine-protein kinase [Gemmatimonadaceae bacterium]